MSDFESEIEQELHRVLDPTMAGSIPAWRVPGPSSLTKRLLGGAGTALGIKVLTGIAVAAAAATIAGAATETVITGSVSPTVWGQQVQESVEACKQKLATNGQRGIGDCVNDFASKHGESTSDTNQNPEAAETKPGDKKPAHPSPAAGKNNTHATPPSERPSAAQSRKPTPRP